MPAPGQFDALTSQAQSEKICAAVAEIYRATAALDVTFGDRIFLLPDIWFPPDVQTPAITVGPGSISDTNLTGGETEQEVIVRSHIIYNEWRTTIGVTDKTAQAALKIMRAAIYANYTLTVPVFLNVPLVKRIVRTSPIRFGLFTPGDPFQVPRVQTLDVAFEKNLDVLTGDAS